MTRFTATLLLALPVSSYAGPGITPRVDRSPRQGDRMARHAASSDETARIQDRRRLRLAWFDTEGVGKTAFNDMAREVEEIFGRVGIVVEWKVRGFGDAVTSDEVGIILLNREPTGLLSKDAMGATHRAPDTQAVWVFLPTVRRALSFGPSSTLPLGDLGRALGRVAAHEIVHLLAPGESHAAAGLMKASLTPLDLRCRRTHLDSRSADAVRSGLARGDAPTAEPGGRRGSEPQ